MDRGTWWAIVHRVKKSRIQLIDHHFHFLHTLNKHNYWLKYTESVFLALRRGKKEKEKPLTIDNCPLSLQSLRKEMRYGAIEEE